MKVTFPAPKGLHLPEGTKVGDTVELLCELKVEQNGKLCLTSIEDAQMEGYEEKDEPPPMGSKFEDAYKQNMSGMMGGQ
jgi:hypothetical protein